ncbi:K02A2.6-like, partial [Pristimantis euphronides]
ILIFSSSLEEHQRHVRIVLERLRENHLYIKLEKCEFHKTKIQFLGYVISPQGLRMDSSKIQAIQDWPAPKNVKEVQRFIGFANFYRRFIRNFSEVVSPITQLTQKKKAFSWSPQAQDAFALLKSRFTSAPILVHPNPELAFSIEVDASDCAI